MISITKETSRMKVSAFIVLTTLSLFAMLGTTTSAHAKDRHGPDMRRVETRRDWDEYKDWRKHERYVRHWRHVEPVPPPRVVYTPPAVVYTPPPPPSGITLVLPLDFR